MLVYPADLEDSRGSTASQLGLARRMAPFYPKPSASIKFPYANIDTTSKHHSGLGLQRAETSLPPPDVSQLISGLYSPPISTRVPPPTAHDCRGMQWDDVLNRVEPPLPNRGLVAPQHSLDLGGLYVSSDSEDELVDALTDSYEGELSSQSIIRELRATAPARRPQELTNKSSGALPLFKRSESFVRGWPIDSGNEVVGNQLHHSAMQFGDGNVVQPVDMVRTSAANQPAFSMNSGLGAPPLVYPNDTTARPVSFERQEKMELLPYSSQSMELSRGVSVQSVQTVRRILRPVLVAPALLYFALHLPPRFDCLTFSPLSLACYPLTRLPSPINQSHVIFGRISYESSPPHLLFDFCAISLRSVISTACQVR